MVEDFDTLNGRSRYGRFQVEWLHPPQDVRKMVENDWNEQVERDRQRGRVPAHSGETQDHDG